MKELREKSTGRLISYWVEDEVPIADPNQEIIETQHTAPELQTELEQQPDPPPTLPDVLTAFRDALALKAPEDPITAGDIQAVIDAWVRDNG